MKCVSWTLSLILSVWAAHGWAQEPEPEPAPRVLAVQAFGDAKGEFVFSRVAGGDGAVFAMPMMGAGVGFGYNPEDDMGIASSEQFHEELGLVTEQREKLTALSRQIQERRSKLFSEFKINEPAKLAPQVREMENQIRDEVKQKLNEILLPHQVERLKQIRVQMQMKNRGLIALSGGELADTLGLTDKQKAELAEKQRKAEKELREKIEQLRRDLYKDVMDEVLTAEQRDKLAKLTGADVKSKPVEAPAIRQPTGAPRIRVER